MRIALVGPVYPYRGGIAHYTTMLCRTLRERGHDVFMVSFKRQYPQWLFPGKSDKDPSQTLLEVEDVHYWIDSINPLTWVRTFYRVRCYQPDLIILQWWVPYWLPVWFIFGLLNRLWLGASLLFVCHNVFPHESKYAWWNKTLAWLALRWGDAFIVQSAEEASRLKQIVDNEIAIVPHPVYDMFYKQRIPRQEARLQLSVPLGVPVLLFFGIVREYKGLKDLINALPLVQERFPDVVLLITGEFWDDIEDYLTLMRSLGLENAVIIDNRYIPNEAVIRYFSAADVLVAPYRRVTGSGVVQMALGMRVPVVTTVENSYLASQTRLTQVPVGDIVSLARGIVRSLEQDANSAGDHDQDSSWDCLVNRIEAIK